MFTVKQLSKIADITPRTVHYYDEIGLLKPSQVGDNGYRYYGEQEVLRLQQILLFRKMDVPLDEIKALLDSPSFDVNRILLEHKQALTQKIAQLNQIVQTVDETMRYLKGEKSMTKKQLFNGLSEEQQAEYSKEAEQKYDPEIVKASNKKWKQYSEAEKQRIGDEGNQIYADLLAAMPEGEASPKVQAIIERWRRHLSYFWTPNPEQLLGLADLYNEDPRFKANYDKIHPDLAEFMRKAVKVYVKALTK
jgi:MerR family transcriptional regulator, thiopeptide resistance regulator